LIGDEKEKKKPVGQLTFLKTTYCFLMATPGLAVTAFVEYAAFCGSSDG
jgi:hypothetical protein